MVKSNNRNANFVRKNPIARADDDSEYSESSDDEPHGTPRIDSSSTRKCRRRPEPVDSNISDDEYSDENDDFDDSSSHSRNLKRTASRDDDSGSNPDNSDSDSDSRQERSSRPCNKARRRDNPWTQLPPPIKSPVDTNDYRMIQLNNGLKALIISCRETEEADPEWANVYAEYQAQGCCNANQILKHYSYNHSSTPGNIYSITPSFKNDHKKTFLPCPDSIPENCELLLRNKKCRKPKGPPKCSVSVMVNTGSHDDPLDFPGLAHLCEHLVHHGSENYPAEGGYQALVQSLSGVTNAFTDKDRTNYHFQAMQTENFEGAITAMKMLADLIAFPLFPLDSVRREVESVDNEFNMRKSGLHFRRDYLLNQLVIEDETHPLRKFAIGNKSGLLPADRENSVRQLQNALKKYQKKFYVADNMNLVVQATLDINLLEAHVGTIFSTIPSSSTGQQGAAVSGVGCNRKGRKISFGTTLYNNDNFNRLITIKPLENAHHLALMWAFPPEIGLDYETKPLDFISLIFDSNCPLGIESYLRENDLIYGIYSGNLNHGVFRNQYVSLFNIDVTLTRKGRNEIQWVLEAIFSYLRLIRESGVTQGAYVQLQKIEAIKFNHYRPSRTLQQVLALSNYMRTSCNDTEILFGHRKLFKFNKALICNCLDEMTPSNALFNLITNLVGDHGFPGYEPLFGTFYRIQDIPDSLIDDLDDVRIFEEFELPNWANTLPNGPIEFNENIEDLDEPKRIFDEPYLLVTYQPTAGLKTAQIGYMILLATPLNLKQATSSRLMDIWISLVRDSLSRVAQSWYNLGLDIKFHARPHDSRLLIFVHGLNYRLHEFVDILFHTLLNFDEHVTNDMFEFTKEHIINTLETPSFEPTRLSSEMLYRLKYSDYKIGFETSEKVRELSLPQFQDFSIAFKSCIKIELVVLGNATQRDAHELAKFISERKYFGHILIDDIPRMQNDKFPYVEKRLFPIGQKCLRIKAMNPQSRMSTIHNHYVLSKATEENVQIATLLVASMKQILFHELRTTQQLGYSVHCELIRDPIDLGLSVLIETHADKFCPCDVDSRIDEFFEVFYTQLKKKCEQLDKGFFQRSGINRQPQHILDYFNKYLVMSNNENFGVRKVSVQVIACCGREEEPCLDKSNVCKTSVWLNSQHHRNTSITPKLVFAAAHDTHASGYDENEINRGLVRDNYFIHDLAMFHRNCERL